MNKRSLFLIVVLALTSLLLSGCFSVTQEMWINADGSAKISIDMGMSKSLLDLAGADSDPLAEFSAQFQGSELYKNVTTRTYDGEGDLRHIVVEFEVDSFEKYILNPGSSTDQSLNTNATLTKLENGNYKFVQNVAGSGSSGMDTMDADTQKMMRAMFEGKYWTTRIHVPQVVSSNGTGGGDMVEWKIPLADMMLDNKPIEMTLEYSLTPGTPGWLLPAILIAVGVIVVAVVVFLLLRRRKSAPKMAAVPPYAQFSQAPPAADANAPQYPQYPQVPPVLPSEPPVSLVPPTDNPPAN
jgi:hypothetical protein